MLFISDANIFIDLYNIGLVDEFDQLNLDIRTTDFVLNELNASQQQIVKSMNITVHSLEPQELINFFSTFGSLGQLKISHQDYSVFYFAKELNGAVLTNDGALRKFAKNRSIEAKGLFYILDEIILSSKKDKTVLIESLELLMHNEWLPKHEITKRIEQLQTSVL
jgi:rRNA-processing protein FCF1